MIKPLGLSYQVFFHQPLGNLGIASQAEALDAVRRVA